METRPESEEPKELEPVTEWEKPTVNEFEVSSITQSGGKPPSASWDGTSYS